MQPRALTYSLPIQILTSQPTPFFFDLELKIDFTTVFPAVYTIFLSSRHFQRVVMEVLLRLVISMIWKCLLNSTKKNAIFQHVFYDKEILSTIVSEASLSFCPGLLDVLQAAAPPTVSWYKQLPKDTYNRWGVYVLVLEKKRHRTRVYVGSATESARGIQSRWALYDRCNLRRPYVTDDACPSNVRAALNSGYKIVYKGQLAWIPIPPAKFVPQTRVLFYALEAMFSYYFWTMSKTDITIESCCPWPVRSFTYDGCCSHNCLGDLIKGHFGLTAAELELLAQQSQENQKASKQAYKARRKAEDPEGVKQESKDYYAQRKAADPEGHKKYYRDKNLRWKQDSPETVQKWANDRRARIKADPKLHARVKQQDREQYKVNRPKKLESKEFYCEVCQRACAKKSELDKHNKSKRHLNKVKEQESGIVRKYQCEYCVYTTDTWRNYREHRKRPHQQNSAGISAEEVSSGDFIMETDSM